MQRCAWQAGCARQPAVRALAASPALVLAASGTRAAACVGVCTRGRSLYRHCAFALSRAVRSLDKTSGTLRFISLVWLINNKIVKLWALERS